MVNGELTMMLPAGDDALELSEDQLRRYARHIVLPEVGGIGQSKLLEASVLIIGAGGLGSPLALYLAAAGVGRLGIVDDDKVDTSNLQRQVLYGERDAGRPKVEAASDRLGQLDAAIRIDRHGIRIDDRSADAIVRDYDIIADGSDNIDTRLAVHDACRRQQRPLVSAAVQAVDGQLTTYKSYLGPPHPCIHCLYPERPSDDALPTCSQGGVLGPAAGVIGTLQAVEVIKELLAIGESLSGTILLYDALAAEISRLRLRRREKCRICGTAGERHP